MKRNQMRKRVTALLWTLTLLAASAVTAYADVAPEPTPIATQPDTTLLTVLIVAVAIIAVAVIAWIIFSNRKNK